MDKPITEEPIIPDKLKPLIEEAEKTYWENFNGEAWLGRCIFLSFYCSIGTCDFCFRSVADNKKVDPIKARRSLGSVLTEALLIKAFDWRIEFLTGGYGIYPPDELERYAMLVSKILGEKIWLNLGVMSPKQLSGLKEYVEGVVASLETLEPTLHKKTCPDKPIEPYNKMLDFAETEGFKRSITLVIGLGEDENHWKYVEEYIKKRPLDRITVYALRPVKGTPYEKGPTPQYLAWWIAKLRTTFPKIEIIAGTAEYRIPEISLLLRAGANAITKLPATKIFNTEKALQVEEEVKKARRKWISKLSSEDPNNACNWEEKINDLPITDEEKESVKNTLNRYLKMMSSKLSSLKEKKTDSSEL